MALKGPLSRYGQFEKSESWEGMLECWCSGHAQCLWRSVIGANKGRMEGGCKVASGFDSAQH